MSKEVRTASRDVRSSPSYQSQEKQQDDGTNRCTGDDADDAGTEVNSQLGEQPSAGERSENADDEFAKQAEATSFHNCASQKSPRPRRPRAK